MNSFGTLSRLTIAGQNLAFHSLPALAKAAGVDLQTLPFSTKILLENLLRHEDGEAVKKADIEAVLKQDLKSESSYEIQFTPGRVLLQDFTGVPVIADLAAMRDGMIQNGGDPQKVNPLRPVDLVIDHSVQMDFYGSPEALQKNLQLEFARNHERYGFLKWGQTAFSNFRVVPPGTGICHQVNLEYLAPVAMLQKQKDQTYIFPDTLVGTDSHTTMINGLGVLGWGVGGIEAEAAMLGQPCTMLIPQVIGFELTGQLPAGATATDLVLTVTQMLRKKGVVGKFVEFFGSGVAALTVADRATISNMAPEYGATVGLFPIDEKTLLYLRGTGREEAAARVETYFKTQELWGVDRSKVQYSDTLRLELSSVEASMAGPSRPHDRVPLSKVRNSFRSFLVSRYHESLTSYNQERIEAWTQMSDSMKGLSQETAAFHPDKDLGVLQSHAPVLQENGVSYNLTHGSIVIAAITSCTNTSNPRLMLGAALLARNAVARGLRQCPWVKTTFAPGSLAVQAYLEAANLMKPLEALGFHIAGFGCSTCIGNSGPLPPHIQHAIESAGLATVSVLSGNRNFEARIHPSVMANYLASPLLVVAAAIAGNINVNLGTDPLSLSDKGEPIFLKDIWPDAEEIDELVAKHVTAKKFETVYSKVFDGDQHWRETPAPDGPTYAWSADSTYLQQPPFFAPNLSQTSSTLKNARILAVFGDFITTDHISPAGNISPKSPAGAYLHSRGVATDDFNSYGSRRGNHEVMIRGTFANVRIRNQLVQKEGGFTQVFPEKHETTIYDAAQIYEKRQVPLVIFAGKEYGSGSSRDWAAKGTRLLGVRAVIAESFERIHRSNLVGMGVLPLQLLADTKVASLELKGDEEISLADLSNLTPKQELVVEIRNAQGVVRKVKTQVRIDTPNELKYFWSGGILPYVLSRLGQPTLLQ